MMVALLEGVWADLSDVLMVDCWAAWTAGAKAGLKVLSWAVMKAVHWAGLWAVWGEKLEWTKAD